ncbi:MAG: hypothetical protein ACK4M6_05210 [Hyphomonas sp.]
MAISRREAKPLCTTAEFALASESFPPDVGTLSEKELRQRITRARKLRDKYADLASKQAREIRGKAEPTRQKKPTGNAATVMKRDFFTETLDRFEAKLGIVERRNQREKAAAEKEKAQAALQAALERKQGASTPASRKAGKGMKAAPSKKAQAFPNLRTMKGAARANNARSQAKRDSKR